MHALLSRARKYDDVVCTSCRPRRTTEAKRGATPLRRQPECPVEPLGNRHVGYLQADPSQTNNFGFVHFLAPRMISECRSLHFEAALLKSIHYLIVTV